MALSKMIVLNVEIEVADPDERNASNLVCANVEKSCDELCWSTFRLTITNVHNLLAVQSKEFKIRNLPFRFAAYKNHNKNLGLRLCSEWDSNASCKIQWSVKLISSDAEKNIKHDDSRIIEKFDSISVKNLAHWNKLMSPKNRYVTNNAIVIEVEVKSFQPKDDHSTDVTGASADVKRARMECPICFESIHEKKISFVLCGHVFCTMCITKAIKANNNCPTCGNAVNLNDVRPAYLPM